MSGGGFKFGPINIEGLPRWGKVCVTLVATVVALLMGVVYVWEHGGQSMIEDFGEPHPVSRLEAAQTTEASVHFWAEEGEDYLEWELADGVARHYLSDNCLAGRWTYTDRHGHEVTEQAWAFHPDRKKEILAAPSAVGIVGPTGAGVSLAGGCPGPGPGCCWDPHPQPMWESPVAQDECVVRIWREFPHYDEAGEHLDSCAHYQDTNRCTGVWFPWVWTRCLH